MNRIQVYRENKAVSYSILSKMVSNPKNLIATEREETPSLTFGSLVDCLMFTPNDFDERFVKTDVYKPGGEMMKWLNAYLNIKVPDNFVLSETDALILKARSISGYNPNLLGKTALAKFHTECDAYLNLLAKAGDKLIVTVDEYNRAISYNSRLLNNEFVSRYFINGEKDMRLEHQKDIYFEINGVPAKALLDGILIDQAHKCIIPFDLKTTSEPLMSFEYEFLKWKYYIQSTLYKYGLQKVYPGYIIENFRFIIINDWEEPMIWSVDEVHHKFFLHGGYLRSGRPITGLFDLIDQYKWHMDTQRFEYTKDVYDCSGTGYIDLI